MTTTPSPAAMDVSEEAFEAASRAMIGQNDLDTCLQFAIAREIDAALEAGYQKGYGFGYEAGVGKHWTIEQAVKAEREECADLVQELVPADGALNWAEDCLDACHDTWNEALSAAANAILDRT